jgi:hypothetical protein
MLTSTIVSFRVDVTVGPPLTEVWTCGRCNAVSPSFDPATDADASLAWRKDHAMQHLIRDTEG